MEIGGSRTIVQLATHVDLLAMVAQLVAQLLGRHVVEPSEQRVEVAEFADQLGGGLLADTGNARDVVGRVALEGLVIDHLVGPERNAHRAVDVVDDGVLDPRARGHQPHARRHELEHVEIDRDDVVVSRSRCESSCCVIVPMTSSAS